MLLQIVRIFPAHLILSFQKEGFFYFLIILNANILTSLNLEDRVVSLKL